MSEIDDTIIFEQALLAIDQGDKPRARELLIRLVRNDRNNPIYWLYTSAVVETRKEQLYCLQQVLQIDPQNMAAQQGLRILGAIQAGKRFTPKALPYRNWKRSLNLLSQKDDHPTYKYK